MAAPTELPVAELKSLSEAIAIIATLFVIFYFSRKEMRNVSIDIEIKVLNDLDEKIHAMGEMIVHRPELIKLLNKKQTNQSPELVCAYYILYMCICAHTHSICASAMCSAIMNGRGGCNG
jgi:CO dehydrogenase/acetyl-CoA synthase alpha subunit